MLTNYSLLLSELIDKSGLSLTEVAEKSEKLGQKITTSYLSKLKNGKMPPPSFKISITLATILKVEPEVLLSAGMLDNTEQSYEELKNALKDLHPELSEEEIEESATNIIFTEEERNIMLERELTPESLKKKYNLVIDDQPATNEEIEEMIKYIKYYRIQKRLKGSQDF